MLCENGVSGNKGEHVLPLWFIDRTIPKNSDAVDVYTVEKNGVVMKWPSGKTVGLEKFYETCVPCCADCNGKLNTRFEQAMAGIGYDSVASLRHFTSGEAAVLGEWWLKTLLLLVHPEATELKVMGESTGVGVIAWPRQHKNLYHWMTHALPAPNGLCVYAYKVDRSAEGIGDVSFPIPEVHADNGTFPSYVAAVEFEKMGLIISFHPGWSADLPGVQEGTLVQLWPHKGELDLSTLTAVPDSPVRFYGLSVTVSGDFDPSGAIPLKDETDIRDRTPNVSSVAMKATA